MKMLSRLLDALPGLRRWVYFLRGIFVSGSWALFEIIFRLSAGDHTSKTEKIRSVLHVSCLSHKPYMLSLLMRDIGIRSEYLAVAAETGWLKLGKRGYDYNLEDSVLNWILHPWPVIILLWRVMRSYDVIHYHFNSLLTPDGRELPFLKRMGKRIVFHFRGCDLRQGSKNRVLNPDINCCQYCDYPPGSCDNDAQRTRLNLARQYGDIFLVTTMDLKDFFPEAVCLPFIAPYGIDLDKITAVRTEPMVFRVVTSSNHPGVDGVVFVRQAVERLKAEGERIELVEVSRTPYEETLAIYKGADVYCGKILMGYYNNAIIECMALGIPCMCWVRPDYVKDIPECPIIYTRPETVYKNLKWAISHRKELKQIGENGVAFVAQRHSPQKLVRQLISIYERRDQGHPQ